MSYESSKKSPTGLSNDNFICVPGKVVDVDDPERMHRIKALIPIINENEPHDEWINALVPWVGAEGYGPVHLPEINTEILIFGEYGESEMLFYLCRYNEVRHTPREFSDGGAGLRVQTDYRIISDGDLYLRGGRVIIEATASVRITAPAGFFINGKRID